MCLIFSESKICWTRREGEARNVKQCECACAKKEEEKNGISGNPTQGNLVLSLYLSSEKMNGGEKIEANVVCVCVWEGKSSLPPPSPPPITSEPGAPIVVDGDRGWGGQRRKKSCGAKKIQSWWKKISQVPSVFFFRVVKVEDQIFFSCAPSPSHPRISRASLS